MHWSVEISTLGKSVATPERLVVEATQWQNALKSARCQTGLDDSLRNFSIEVLDDGVRAVDPANRLRYLVRKMKDEVPAEEAAPHTQRRGSAPPPAYEATSPLNAHVQESFNKPKAAGIVAIPMDRVPPPAKPMVAPPPEEKPRPAPVPAAAPVAPPPPAKQLVPHKQVLQRGSEPTPGSPLTYREYGYAVLPFTTEAEAEELILAKFEEVKQTLAHIPRGKLVNIAIFDHEFDSRPLRPPLVALIWKDWRGRDPELHYPSRPGGSSPSLTPSMPSVSPVPPPPEPPRPEPVAQPAPAATPAGQALYQEPVRVPPRTATAPTPAQSVIVSQAVRVPSTPPPAAPVAPLALVEVPPPSPPIAAEPVLAQPVAAEPVVAQPVAAEPVVAQPVAAEPAVAQPAAAEPAVAQPAAAEPVVAQPAAAEPVLAQPVAAEPVLAQPAAAEAAVTPVEAPVGARASAPPVAVSAAPIATDERVDTQPEIPSAKRPSSSPPIAATVPSAQLTAALQGAKGEEAPAPEPPKVETGRGEPKDGATKKAVEPGKKPVAVAKAEGSKAKPGSKPTPIPKPGVRLSDDELIADLFEATADMAFLRDAEEGADFVLNVVLEKFRSQAGMVQLYDINKREFVIMRAAGPHANLVLGGRTAERDPLVHEIMKRRRPYVLDVAKDGRVRAGRWAALGAHPKTILAAAVELHGQFLGIVEIANPVEGEFSSAEVNGMAYIADSFAEFLASRGIVFESDTSLQTGK